MEVNGKQLNKKVNWEKFNPFLQEITKDKGKNKKLRGTIIPKRG